MRRPTEVATATRRNHTDFVVSHPSPLRHGRTALKEAARLGLFAGARVRRRARLRRTRPTALPSSGGTAAHDGGEDMPATNVHWLFLGVHLQHPWFPFSGSRV